MTPTQFLRILLARKRVALVVLLLVFGADLAITLSLPKKYSAVATVVSDPKAPDPIYGYTLLNYGGATTNSATQGDIITSDRVALRVVRLLGLDKDESARAEWQSHGNGKETFEQYFADLLLKNLEVKPSRESDVINIQYTGSDPVFASDAANAFAKAYVDVSVELRTDPARASAEFFEARTRQLREDVEKAQARLSEFQRSHGITITDEHLDMENSRLNELSTQLTTIQGARAESQSRKNQAFTEASTSPDVMQSPVIQQLRTDIARSEAKVQELTNRLGPNHPQLKAAQAELESLKSKLQREMHEVAGSVGTSNVVNLQREAEIGSAVEEQKKRMLELRTLHDQATVLQKDVEEAQKEYELVAQRRSQTYLESLNRQGSVTVLSNARAPTRPARPRVLLNLLFGLLVGGLLGITAAMGLELRDRRVRGMEDARVFGLPILASLPWGRQPASTERERSPVRSRLLRLKFKRRPLGSSA